MQLLLSRLLIAALPFLVLNQVTGHPKEFTVGVLYWSSSIPGQVAMRRGLEEKNRTLNEVRREQGLPQIRLITQVAGDGSEGIRNQVQQMNQMIRQKPDLIIVQPTDISALSSSLTEANRTGIPVIAYDQYIRGGSLVSFISSDNFAAGYHGGEYIGSTVKPGSHLRIILVDYPHVSSTVERVDGFLSGLKSAGRSYTVLRSYKAVEPVSGRNAGKAILRDFPQKGSIDVIFTVNDGGGLSVVDELYRAGRREIAVATTDGDPASIENIKAGRLTVIDSAQFCGPMGAIALTAAADYLDGKKVPKQILIPPFPVTRETAAKYPGWMGPIPGPFRKPWKSSEPLWKGDLNYK